MNNLFQTKVKYQKINEHGKQVKANENYIVEAVNFTEAETRIHEIMSQYGTNDLLVHSISRTNISEVVFREDGQYYYKAKITWEDFDDKSGKASKVTNHMLITANSVEHCNNIIDDELINMLVPFEVVSVSLSNILDVFPLQEQE